MSLPPDEPTRPLRPAEPAAPVYRETVVEHDDAAVFRTEVMERLDGLRNWVALATLLSLVAIALSAWTFLSDDDEDDTARGGGVRAGAVQNLDDRIDRLEGQAGEGVSEADLTALKDEQTALASQVEELAAAQADAAPAEPATTEDAEARESIAALDQSIQDLDARVQSLEEQPAP